MKFILVLLLVPLSMAAQQQSTSDTIKLITLDEVRIQGYYNGTAKDSRTKRKDGQARTERLIDALPGAGLISRGAFAQEPVIRGLSDGQIVVNINGMKIFGACTDRMDPATSYIEPNNLQSIKLNNGPGIDAGGATIGGSLNFNLKEPQLNAEERFETSVGAGFEGNAPARQFLANWQYSDKKWAIYLNGIHRKAFNYTPGGNKADLRNSFGIWTKEIGFSVDDKARILYSQYEKWNAGLSAKYRLNDNNFLNADFITDNGYDIGYPALTMDVAFAKANIASLGHQYVNNPARLSLIDSKLYFNYIHHAMDDTKRPLEQLVMHMDMPGNSMTSGFYSKATYHLPHQLLQFVVNGYMNRWHAAMKMYPKNGGASMYMLTLPDAQRLMMGLDVADNIHINDFLKIIAGARAEWNHSGIYSGLGKNQVTVIYEGGVTKNHLLLNAYLQPFFNIGQHGQFFLKFAKSLRAPTLKEMYSVFLLNRVDDYEYIGNPNLKNEGAINIDATISYNSYPFYVSLKGFGYFFKNYIAGFVEPGLTPTMGARGVKRYQNISSATMYGGECTTIWQPFSQVSLSSINTYQAGLDGNHNALPMISPFHSTNKIEWDPKRNWNLYAESIYAATQIKVSSFYGESETPAFNVINAGVVKTLNLNKSRLVLSLSGLNIFNQYYYEHTDVIKLPRPGRNIVLHGTLYF